MRNAIEVHDVMKSFGRQQVLKGLNMTIPAQTVYGFIGVNGAGKTTTFGILSSFLPFRSGTFSINGTLSIFPQDTKLYEGINVEKQLRFFCELGGIKKRDIGTEIERVLTMVNMQQYKKKRPERLSHGMNKRLAIAQSFIGDPDIILLDEPIAGLDPQNAHEIKELIKKLGKEKTIVVSSHTLSEISEMCDLVGLIHNGKMQFEGSLEKLTESQSIIKIKIVGQVDLKKLEAIPGIITAQFNESSQTLSMHYARKESSPDNIIRTIIEHLYKNDIGILEITRGEKLEDSFLKMVR